MLAHFKPYFGSIMYSINNYLPGDISSSFIIYYTSCIASMNLLCTLMNEEAVMTSCKSVMTFYYKYAILSNVFVNQSTG